MTLLYGCDVSTYQSPALVDWTKRDFGIVRATYGTSRDKRALEHVARIRGAGKTVGLYHFFRADQAVAKQADTFLQVAHEAGLGPGDILPCIDVEDFPGHQLGPGDTMALAAFEAALKGFGGVVYYVTQRDWHRLGKPAWMLEKPLWVAHYPSKGSTKPLAKPATPNAAPWRIWQWLVGPLGVSLQQHDHPQAVDQNVATSPLPTIGEAKTKADDQPIDAASIPFVHLTDDDWEEMAEARDHRVTTADDD